MYQNEALFARYSLAAFVAFLVTCYGFCTTVTPGCDQRTNQHYLDRMQMCIDSCGSHGVMVNQPGNNGFSCLCR